MADTSSPHANLNRHIEALRIAGLPDYERVKAILALLKAGDWLSLCAQTTGGAPGPDAVLQGAINDWSALKGPTP